MAHRIVRHNPPFRRANCPGLVLSAGLAAALLGLHACGPRAPSAPNPPLPSVTVAKPLVHSVIEWDEYTGRLDAVDFVEVRARVGGLIMSTPFQAGAMVHAGDVLVEIDVRSHQAELSARLAAEAQAAAQVDLATIEFRRIEAIPESARSPTERDRAAAELEEAKAVLSRTQAEVEAARLNVEWCRVTAPITGRVSSRLVTEGNLISGGTGQSTLLTTITSIDPIYCYIEADERSVLKYAKLARAGQRVSARQARIPAFLQLADETGFPHQGEIDFVDNRADPNTGTIRGRGVFSNSDGWLLPGFFARVRIPGSGRYEALLVPDAAVVTDQNEKRLLVVAPDNIVQTRLVKLGALFGELRAIESGIDPADRVIINGLLLARPGATVNPVAGEISAASLPADLGLEHPTTSTAPAASSPGAQP